jgi:hypothetical protein
MCIMKKSGAVSSYVPGCLGSNRELRASPGLLENWACTVSCQCQLCILRSLESDTIKVQITKIRTSFTAKNKMTDYNGLTES